MGKHVNSRTLNVIAWATAIAIGSLALYYAFSQITGG
jgi:Mn2+/Fe2+ NRAMP family transporter